MMGTRRNQAARRRVGAVVLSATLLMAGAARAHEGHPTVPTRGAKVVGEELLLSESAVQAIGLRTAKVTLDDMPAVVRANGTVAVPWRQHAFVTTLVGGIVDEVLARPGDYVRPGAVLARIRSVELEQLQLEMLQAAADLDYTETIYRQQQHLAEMGTISGKEFLETARQRAQATMRLQLAIIRLKTIGLRESDLDRVCSTGETIAKLDITSSRGGRIVHSDVRIGESVQPQQHLFHVVDNGVVWCVADVLETDAASVRVGQPCTIRLDAIGKQFSGSIDVLGLSVDADARVVRAFVELQNGDLQIRPGMSARVAIRVGGSRQAIVCPRESLFQQGNAMFVLLERGNGKFVRRQVNAVRLSRDRAEISTGLFPGDFVTTTGTHLLSSLFAQESQRPVSEEKRQAAGEPAADEPGRSLRATGVVETPTASKFFSASRVRGRLARILVEHGQHVQAGQSLAEIESIDLLDLQLRMLADQQELRWAQQGLDRIGPLAESGSVPRSKVVQLENEVRKLSHAVSMHRRRLSTVGLPQEVLDKLLAADAVRDDLSALVVRTIDVSAPRAGRVSRFDVLPGQVVQRGASLFEIHDLEQVWVKAYLFEDEAPDAVVGRSVKIEFAADENLKMRGRIVRAAPTRAEWQRVFPVWLELDNPDHALRPGMLANVRIDKPSPSMVRKRPAARTGARQRPGR